MSNTALLRVRKVQERKILPDRVTWVFEGSHEALKHLARQLSQSGVEMKKPEANNDSYRAEFYRLFDS
ncbi:MAG: hypothetical protein ACWA5L_11530 [bacterium]